MQYDSEETSRVKSWEILQVLFSSDQADALYLFVKTENDEIQFYNVKMYSKFTDFF